MDEATPLDLARAAIGDGPDAQAARLRFYERLAASELFVLLDPDRAGPAPQVFDLSDGRFVMAFDREHRLAAFAGAPAPFAALPGRTLVRSLAGQGAGIGINLGVAPSSFLMDAEAVDWLDAMLPGPPAEVAARPVCFAAPRGLPAALAGALDARFASAGGLAAGAGIASVTYDDGRSGHMVAFVGAVAGAERALAAAVAEALAFSGLDAGEIDVAFLSRDDPATARFARAALMFEVPGPSASAAPPAGPRAPGSDPDSPPRLR